MLSDATARQYFYAIIAIAMAVLRIAGHKSPMFQAVAHCFTAALLASGWTEYQFTWSTGGKGAMAKVYIGVAVSLVELGCFLWGKFAG